MTTHLKAAQGGKRTGLGRMQRKIDCKIVLETDGQRELAASLKTGGVLRVEPRHASSSVAFLTAQLQLLAELKADNQERCHPGGSYCPAWHA